MRALTIASLTSSPRSITALALRPTGVPAATASRSMSPVDSWIIPRLACSRAACVPLPAPGGPRRMMFIMAALSPAPLSSAPSRRRLELGLLDEVAVLVRDQVALNLADGVHRHVDDDQQARAAEPEVETRLRRKNIGDEADHGQIGRSDDGDAVEQIVEIFLGRLAWPDAGDEASVTLQIVRRFLAVELHRRVEEGEEDDAG